MMTCPARIRNRQEGEQFAQTYRLPSSIRMQQPSSTPGVTNGFNPDTPRRWRTSRAPRRGIARGASPAADPISSGRSLRWSVFEENLGAVKVELSESDIAQINESASALSGEGARLPEAALKDDRPLDVFC